MFEKVSKILVIDDERSNIQILYQALSEDYTILAAYNGEDGIRIAKDQEPDLILLDIMLGGVDGYQVCEKLKQESATSGIPIIFVTAQDSTEDELKGLELGAVDYFRKPFSIPLVKMRVSKQMELKRKTDMLEYLSLVDGLTGVANRRQFDEKLDQAIRYVDRNHRGLSLLLMDIDFFKQYNDTYGHVKGDEVLKRVANVLRKGASRPLDFVARYGGEEFAVIIIDATKEEGEAVAEKLRLMVENMNIAHAKSPLARITMSVGVTHISSQHTQHIDAKDFIEDADQSLYLAKEDGRNRVVSSDTVTD